MNTAQKLYTLDLSEEYAILRDYLLKQTRYVTQREITADTGLSGSKTRQICNAYPCLAVGSTEGYRCARYAPKQDIQHAVSTLTGRSVKMLERAQALSGLLVR